MSFSELRKCVLRGCCLKLLLIGFSLPVFAKLPGQPSCIGLKDITKASKKFSQALSNSPEVPAALTAANTRLTKQAVEKSWVDHLRFNQKAIFVEIKF